MRHLLPALFFVVMVSTRLCAAPSLEPAISIDALVTDVVATNAERRFYEQELAAAGVARSAAGRLADPELSVEFGEKRTTNANGSRFGEGPAYSVAIAQPLEFNGRIALRRAIADRQIDLAELGYRQYRATLAARARTLAYGLFTASAKADAARAATDRIEAVVRVLVQRDIAGPSPLIETRILEAGAITTRRQAEVAEQEYNTALYELNQLRGTPFASRIKLITPTTALPPLPPVDALVDRAHEQNFEIRSLQAELAQQGLRVSLARRSRLGSVNVGPYYRSETAGTTDRFAGVRVTVPLPMWNAQAGEVATQQARVAQAESAVFAKAREVDRKVFDAASIYRERTASLARLAPGAQARFAEMARLAERSYRLGAVTVTIYLDAQRQVLDATAALLDTRRDALAARLQLDVLTGADPGATS